MLLLCNVHLLVMGAVLALEDSAATFAIGAPILSTLVTCAVLIRGSSRDPKQVRIRMRDGTRHQFFIKAPVETLIEAQSAITSSRDTSGEGWLSPSSDGAVSSSDETASGIGGATV